MRHDVDWSTITPREPGDFNNPAPGGYPAVILRVEDREDKQYLEIQWDFPSGPYQGANQETFSRAGFWPITLRRSYKDNALGFFKAFLTALEESNPGYRFDSRNINGLVGKRMGVVLGEEEYQKRNGEIGERPYVYQVRSLAAIQSGDFKVPELKCLDAKKPSGGSAPAFPPPPAQSYGRSDFSYMDDDDGELPF